MSIPLDRLYHYIENVAQDVHGNTIIYRFWPHGSKNADELKPTKLLPELGYLNAVQVFCNDQEPLNFALYQNYIHHKIHAHKMTQEVVDHFKQNLRKNIFNVYDSCVLLHSEKNSEDVEKYKHAGFVPSYYWSHGIIARDWFRYAQHIDVKYTGKESQLFLIYNRDWSGTREYRLKLAELLVSNNILNDCQTSLKFTSNESHYSAHVYHNTAWKPTIELEQYYAENVTTPCYSADFDVPDYETTLCEVVLETLFDTEKIHLTEKTLRPIALGRPFILCAPPGSLEYLKHYGFKTFDGIIDESYDQITDPVNRMNQIVKVMKTMSQWDADTKTKKFLQLQKIVDFNKKHFFSDDFSNQITNELKQNLNISINQVIDSNTYSRCLDLHRCTSADANYLEWQAVWVKPQCIDAFQESYKQLMNLKINSINS
jgi:hypothetical protein